MSAPAASDRIAELARRLHVWCEETGHAVDAAGRVSEATAAQILGKSPGTLRNWRAGANRLPYYRGSPVKYALRDLAEFIECTKYHEPSHIYTAGGGT